MAQKIKITDDSVEENQMEQSYSAEPDNNYYTPPTKKTDIWRIVAAVAIIMLLFSNSFWILNTNQKKSESDYLELVHMNSLTADYYQSLRENVGPQSPSWSNYENGWPEDVVFCADLAKHDAGLMYWQSVDESYFEITRTHAYKDAAMKMVEIINLIGISKDDLFTTKIDKILTFINNNLEYSPDLVDKYFSPVETLAYGSGDCDDFSILAACLFEMNGIESAISFYKNDYNKGHALVLIHEYFLDGYGCYHYDDLTDLGLSSGRWIMIEPQRLIEEQQDSTYFEQWKLEAAAEA